MLKFGELWSMNSKKYAIDLGQPKTVYNMIITNRGDCRGSLHSLRLLLLLFHCSLVVCCAGEIAVKTYNAALNKPSFQSSVWSEGGHDASANLANDGNLATDFEGHDGGWQCSASQHQTNPWWLVDLGQLTPVYSVILTNRGDDMGTVSNKSSFSRF